MIECRSLIDDAMKVVCDTHSHDEELLTHDHLFNSLLRPRLPFEVSTVFAVAYNIAHFPKQFCE